MSRGLGDVYKRQVIKARAKTVVVIAAEYLGPLASIKTTCLVLLVIVDTVHFSFK